MRAFRQIAARLAMGKEPLAEPQDPMIGGWSVGDWFQVFTDTHTPNGMGGLLREEWPDGRTYIEQPAVVLTALGLVKHALMEATKSSAK